MSIGESPIPKGFPTGEKKRASKRKPASPEQLARSEVEEIERFIDANLNELLEHHSAKVNEGNNGVIFRLDYKNIPQDLIDRLVLRGIDLQSEAALKVLKLYSPGVGSQEFKMHQKAYQILEQHRGDGAYAQTPKPLLFKDVKLIPGIQEKLREAGVEKIGDRAAMIAMDYIDGEDLATILYRAAVKAFVERHPDATARLQTAPEHLRFDQLQRLVGTFLDFHKAGGKGMDEGARAFEERKLANENSDKLMRFLQNSGYQLHPSILEKIKNSMDAFHANGLAFRDGHHRNFMIVGNPEAGGAAPEVFIIDYGTSVEFEGAYANEKKRLYFEEMSVEGKKEYLDDEFIVSHLKPLTISAQERQTAPMKLQMADLESRIPMLQRSTEWVQFRQRVLEKWNNGTFDPNNAFFFECPAKPDKLTNFLAAMLELAKTHPESRQTIRQYLIQKQNDPQFPPQKTSRFITWLQSEK